MKPFTIVPVNYPLIELSEEKISMLIKMNKRIFITMVSS